MKAIKNISLDPQQRTYVLGILCEELSEISSLGAVTMRPSCGDRTQIYEERGIISVEESNELLSGVEGLRHVYNLFASDRFSDKFEDTYTYLVCQDCLRHNRTQYYEKIGIF